MLKKGGKSKNESKEKMDGSLKWSKGSSKRSVSLDDQVKVIPSSPRGFCGPPGPSRDAVLRHRHEEHSFEGVVLFNQDESLAGAASPKRIVTPGEGEPCESEARRSRSAGTGAKKRKKRKSSAPVTKPEEFRFATEKRQSKKRTLITGPPVLQRAAAKARIVFRPPACFNPSERLQRTPCSVSTDGGSDQGPAPVSLENRNPNQTRPDIGNVMPEKNQDKQRHSLNIEVTPREQNSLRKPPLAPIEVPRLEPFSPSSPPSGHSLRGSRANNSSSRESSTNCTSGAHPMQSYPLKQASPGSPRPSSSGSSSSSGSRRRVVESLPVLRPSPPPSSSSSDMEAEVESPRIPQRQARHNRILNQPSCRTGPHSHVDDQKTASVTKFKEEMTKLDHHEKYSSRTDSVPPRDIPWTPPQEAQKRALSLGRGRRQSNSPERKEECPEKKTVRFFLEQNVEVLHFDEEPDLLGFGGSSSVPARASRRVFGGEFCQNLGVQVNHAPAPSRMIGVGQYHSPRLPAMSSMIDRPSQRPGIRDLHTTLPGHP